MATITKLPSGKFRAQVRRKGESHGRTFTKRADAVQWAASIEATVDQKAATGVIAPPPGLTFGDVVEAYLDQVVMSEAARSTLRATCRVIGKVKLRDLNAATMQRWLDHRLGEGVTGATVAQNIGLITGVLKWARFTRHLDVDPALTRQVRASLTASRISTTSAERDRYPTDAEIDLMRRTFAGQPNMKLPMADLMDFALATGMRLGEIVRIEHGDLADNERTILIRDRKDPKRKAGNHQRVPLSSVAMSIIERQPTKTGRIFPYVANSASRAWIIACRINGIEDLHFHDLRHRAITDLFARGLTIPQVALISGHKTWAQLRRYTQTQAVDVVGLLG